MTKILIILTSLMFALSLQAEGEKKAKSGGKVSTKGKFSGSGTSTSGTSRSAASIEKLSESTMKLPSKSPWGAALYGAFSAGTNAINTGNYGFSTYESYAEVKYSLNDNESLKIRQYLTYDSARIQDQVDLSDTALQYVNTKSLKLSKSKDLITVARFYLPTSENSQTLGKYQARLYLENDGKLFGKWDYDVFYSPRLYGYTRDQAGQTGFVSVWYAAASYNLTEKISYGPWIAFIQAYNNSGLNQLADDPADAVAPTNEDEFDIAFDVNYKATDKVKLGFSIEQDRDLRSGSAFTFLNDQETSYYLSAKLSL